MTYRAYLVWCLAIAVTPVFVLCGLPRKCSCTAGCWCAAGWRSAPAAPRAATAERGGRPAAGTRPLCRARRWPAAPSASTGRTRTRNAQPWLPAARLLGTAPHDLCGHQSAARSPPFFKHHAVGADGLPGLTPSDPAQRSGETGSLLTDLTLLGLPPPKVKSYAAHTDGSSPDPPFLFYSKSPFIGGSEIRSWAWHFKLGT